MATTFVVLNFFLHCFYELNPVILLLSLMICEYFIRAHISEKRHEMKLVQSPIAMFIGFIYSTKEQCCEGRMILRFLMAWHLIGVHCADESKHLK